MYQDSRAANMAAYLLCRAGADGLSSRQLLALMYLAERNFIKQRGWSIVSDDFILTEHGPAMKHTRNRILGGLEHSPGAHHEWDRIAAAAEPAFVADTGAAYATRPAPQAIDQRLVLRQPQPPARWDDGVIMDPPPDEWDGKDRGIPYLGDLARAYHDVLDETWRIHGERDEDDLIQHALELPECGGSTTGDLTLRTILKTLGYTQREIQDHLAFAEERDHLQKFAASLSQQS